MTEAVEERKHFVVPSREEIIAEIKQLDDEIEHVSLNLIKCDFNAVEKDVERAFPEHKFLKINKYNPGSFEVVFQMKMDAIEFIRNSKDKKILTRRFYIKLGRQQREMIQDWACVGFVPHNFKPYKHPIYYPKNHVPNQNQQKSPKNTPQTNKEHPIVQLPIKKEEQNKNLPIKETQSKDLSHKEQGIKQEPIKFGKTIGQIQDKHKFKKEENFNTKKFTQKPAFQQNAKKQEIVTKAQTKQNLKQTNISNLPITKQQTKKEQVQSKIQTLLPTEIKNQVKKDLPKSNQEKEHKVIEQKEGTEGQNKNKKKKKQKANEGQTKNVDQKAKNKPKQIITAQEQEDGWIMISAKPRRK